MCKHKAFSVVAFDAVAIAQCDVCGMLLPSVDVDMSIFPAHAVDNKALDFAYGRAFSAMFKDWDRLDSLSPDALAGAVREAWKGV
jgi:hypothetical protein